MLIRNYGLLWNPQKVFWGRPKVEGTLLGVTKGRKRSKPVDFREQIAVYVLYQNFKIVYVGQTGAGKQRLFSRLKHHRKDHLADRWDAFSWFGVIPVNPKSRVLRATSRVKPTLSEALNHIEAILIEAIEPPLNLQSGRFGNAEQYFQKLDKQLPPRLDQKIDVIASRLSKLEKKAVRPPNKK